MFDKDQVIVYHNDKPKYALNKALIEKQGLDHKTVKTLIALHQEKLDLFDEVNATEDKEKLSSYADLLEEIEFKMQKTWGFPEDANYHEWYLIPKCLCPKMDNRDYRGTKYRIHVQGCPIHDAGQFDN